MKFDITIHAKERMEERNISHPNIVPLKAVGKNKKKKVRKACIIKGYNSLEYVYFSHGWNIYVCKQIDIAHYLLITTFKLP